MPTTISVKHYIQNNEGSNPIFSHAQNIDITLEQILLSSIFIGRRPNDILAFGHFSEMEMIYRIAIVAANIREYHNGLNWSFSQTDAFSWLDPSEKSAVTYFLGMTLSQVLANHILRVPYLMHFDVYTKQNPYSYVLPPTRLAGNTRPDLVGVDVQGNWAVFEAKGRTYQSDWKLRTKMKDQTRGVSSIDNVEPHRFGVCANLGGGELSVDWVDPSTASENAFSVDLDRDQFILGSYNNIANMLQVREGEYEGDFEVLKLQGTGVKLKIYRRIANILRSVYSYRSDWGYAPNLDEISGYRNIIYQAFSSLDSQTERADGFSRMGIFIELDDSWR